MRVLVVDDDPDIRLAVRFGLAAAGHTVTEADSLAAGLAAARRDAPDAVLCDVLLADGDGAELLPALRAEPGLAAVPVVFLTAAGDPATRERLLAAGARGVLTKPFDPRTIAGSLETSLAGR